MNSSFVEIGWKAWLEGASRDMQKVKTVISSRGGIDKSCNPFSDNCQSWRKTIDPTRLGRELARLIMGVAGESGGRRSGQKKGPLRALFDMAVG